MIIHHSINNYQSQNLNLSSTIIQENLAAISLKNLWFSYNGQSVLEDINLEIKELDFLGIIGPNGGGKTTLLKLILGLLTPTRGEVKILGRSVQKGRRYIGYVPQTVQFDYHFPISVWEVVQMGRLGKKPWWQKYQQQDREIVAKALEQVEIPHLSHCPLGELSGGQRQRVYIARALATQPQILLLDEPTASVDPQVSTNIYKLLQKLNQDITIIMISHDLQAISASVKNLVCLNRRLSNPVETIPQSPRLPVNHLYQIKSKLI